MTTESAFALWLGPICYSFFSKQSELLKILSPVAGLHMEPKEL